LLLLSFGAFLPRLGRIPNVQRPRPLSSFLCELFTLGLACILKDATPPELILSNPQQDSVTSAPLQSLHTHKGAISSELFNTQTSKELNPFSLLLQMENLDALLAILHSSNLLLSVQGVQQPCEDPSVDSSSNYRTQRVLSLCLSAH
jgi:hypothetical protein